MYVLYLYMQEREGEECLHTHRAAQGWHWMWKCLRTGGGASGVGPAPFGSFSELPRRGWMGRYELILLEEIGFVVVGTLSLRWVGDVLGGVLVWLGFCVEDLVDVLLCEEEE